MAGTTHGEYSPQTDAPVPSWHAACVASFFTSVRVRSRPGRLHLSLFNNMVEKKENRDKYSNKKKAHLSTPAWTTVSDAKVKQQNYNDYTNSSNSK